MGGHGGLNILPQKSWNVYGQKQRQKVKRDEENAKEEEEAALDVKLQSLRQGNARRERTTTTHSQLTGAVFCVRPVMNLFASGSFEC